MAIDIVVALGMLADVMVADAQSVLREAVKEIRRLRKIEAAATEIVLAKEEGMELVFEHEVCQAVLRLTEVD